MVPEVAGVDFFEVMGELSHSFVLVGLGFAVGDKTLDLV